MVALVVILYEGGLGTAFRDVRAVAGAGRSRWRPWAWRSPRRWRRARPRSFLDVDATTALLIGAVVASTDAAAVFSVLRDVGLPRRLHHLLEAESGANDPMAVLLTVGLLADLGGPRHRRPTGWCSAFASWGAVSLVGLGRRLGRAPSCSCGPASPARRCTRCSGSGSAGSATASRPRSHMSGFLAVYVTGMAVAARAPSRRRAVRTFHQGLASTAQIGLFLLLGLLVFPSRLDEQALGALRRGGRARVHRSAARGARVRSAGWASRRRSSSCVSWAGLRGAVPIVLATFPLTAGYPEGQLIFDVVFFVVVLSVLVQGLTVAAPGPPAGARGGARPRRRRWRRSLPIDAPGVEVLEIEVGSLVRDRRPAAGRRAAAASTHASPRCCEAPR